MDIQKEREACELSMANGDMTRHTYLQNLFKFNETMSGGKERYNDYQNGYWKGWQSAKAQAIPEGYVLVEIKDIREIVSTACDALCDEKVSSVFEKTGEPSTWFDHYTIAENNILKELNNA